VAYQKNYSFSEKEFFLIAEFGTKKARHVGGLGLLCFGVYRKTTRQ
jgi:hypothetical protein